MNSVMKFTSVFRSIMVSAMILFRSVSAFNQSLPTAQQVASEMTIGWNIGNSLEVPGDETGWGNPKVTQQLIDSVKASGFNTIRIPCAWDSYADQSTHEISAEWLARVKEVVDYCVNNDMYTILNIHWDGGWLENNVTEAKQSSVNIKQDAYWTQIANYFKDYDEHLLFASANEPGVDNSTQMSVLLSYHQTFIDAVRATGGNNDSRVLIIQGPSTDIDKTNQLMTTLPTDPTVDHLMVEIHYYTPWNFCGLTKDESWGNMFYYWGEDYHSVTDLDHNPTWGEEDAVESYFQMMKSQFVDIGIPALMGEYGAIKRTSLTGDDLALHIASREYYFQYVTDAAIRHGIIPVYWDNGYAGNNGYALFNRNSGAIVDQGAVDALMTGAGNTNSNTINIIRTTSTNIFPNPFNESTNIVIDNPEQVNKVVILDRIGRQVSTVSKADISDELKIGQELSKGVYFVQVFSNSEMKTFTISKIR